MKKFKKMLSVLTASIMLLSIANVTAFAETPKLIVNNPTVEPYVQLGTATVKPGTKVATLSAKTATMDSVDGVKFEVLSTSTDNNIFEAVGNELRVKGADLTKTTYSIKIKATKEGFTSSDEAQDFTITVKKGELSNPKFVQNHFLLESNKTKATDTLVEFLDDGITVDSSITGDLHDKFEISDKKLKLKANLDSAHVTKTSTTLTITLKKDNYNDKTVEIKFDLRDHTKTYFKKGSIEAVPVKDLKLGNEKTTTKGNLAATLSVKDEKNAPISDAVFTVKDNPFFEIKNNNQLIVKADKLQSETYTLQVSVTKVGVENPINEQDVVLNVENPNRPASTGSTSQSSVRPGDSTPAKKDEVKKEEPKKEEPKKEEPKKETPATEKVSTKLVIGQKSYTVMENGKAVEKTMDVAPMVHQGRTVLPARMISELLGVDVKYDAASKTANFMYGDGNKVSLTLGQKFMMVNGQKVNLTADILNVNGRILLPLTDIQKAFAELGLKANVGWDAGTKSVTIEK